MDHVFRVRSVQALADLLHYIYGVLWRESATCIEQRFKVRAVDEFHGDEAEPIRHAEIENPDYVTMRDLPRQECFLLQPPQGRWIRCEIRPDGLERNGALKFDIKGFSRRCPCRLAPTGGQPDIVRRLRRRG